MKRQSLLFMTPLLLLIALHSCSQRNTPENSSVLGTFAASTPCSRGTRPLPGISSGEDCELMRWEIILFKDELKKTPSTYRLHCMYGLPKQGTPGLTGEGKEVTMEGEWTIKKGIPTNPDAIVYRLVDPDTKRVISLLKLSDDLLHLLDADQRLMIGTAAWSYTFNRIRNR